MSESDIRVILSAIARLETKVDTLQREAVEAKVKAEDLRDKFDIRITKLEQFRWLVLGAVTASSGAAGAALAKLLTP